MCSLPANEDEESSLRPLQRVAKNLAEDAITRPFVAFLVAPAAAPAALVGGSIVADAIHGKSMDFAFYAVEMTVGIGLAYMAAGMCVPVYFVLRAARLLNLPSVLGGGVLAALVVTRLTVVPRGGTLGDTALFASLAIFAALVFWRVGVRQRTTRMSGRRDR